MKGRWLVLVMLFFGLFGASYISLRLYASRQACPVCAMREGKMSCCDGDAYICKKLAMSPEQTQSMKKVDMEFDQEKQDLYKQMDKDKKKITALLLAKSSDSSDMKSAVASLGQHRGQLDQAALKHLVKIKKLLDPSQQQEFLAMISEQILN